MSAECLSQIGQAARDRGVSENSKLRQILGLKTVHYLAFFILVYGGVEATIGGACEIHLTVCLHDGISIGWIVTYIIDVRRGGPSSGWIFTVSSHSS